MTRRLFIALKAGRGVETEILAVQKKLKISADKKEFSVRWIPIENWHVTMVFLGDMLSEDQGKIESAIQSVSSLFPPFSLKVSDVGGFPTERDARVVWAGVQRSRALLNLQTHLQASLARELNKPMNSEFSDYSPHLTLGRMKNPKAIGDLISPFVRKKFGKMQVSEVILFESILATPFPVYKPLAAYPLLGTPEIDATIEEI